MSRPIRNIALQVGFVLACAAAGFVLRSALISEPGSVASLPAVAPHAPDAFALGAAQSRAVAPDTALIARAKGNSIVIYRRPGSKRIGRLQRRVFNRQPIPLTFLVHGQRKGWARVQLPTRPNLALAWVRRRDIRYSTTPYRVIVALKSHRIELLSRGKVMWRSKVAVGRSVSPTPLGRYFITDVIRPPDPSGFYGTYSIGLAAHSKVITNFGGGNGQIGIHGTNQPAAIGTDVSHGCIRVTNADVTRLARLVPLGTPVDIRA